MNEEQLRLFIRQAFALQAREDQIIKGQSPALMRSMANVRRLVETLPPEGTLFREQAWREMLPQIRNYLRPYNEEFANQLAVNLAEEAPEMAEEAVKMVEAVGAPAAPQVPAARAVPTDLGRLPIADNVAAALRSRVNGKRVADLFEQQGRLLMSDWMRTNERAINNVVTKGILDATPTQDIAEGIVEIIQRQGQEYISTAGPTAARKIQSDAKAIARTAVQDANRQVHEEVWKANEDALSDLKWEWVAALDARTCPICAPLDGQRWDTRREAPQWPAHINCRCQVVAVDPDDEADVRSGIVIRDPKKNEPFKGDRAYKTKVKVDGKKFYRKAVDIKPIKGAQVTYGDFLHSSNQLTREKFFGSKAKAQRFMDLVDKRNMDPRTALKRLVDEGKFKPDVKLGKLPAVKVNKPKPKPAPKSKPKPAPKPVPAPKLKAPAKASDAPKAAPTVDVSQMRRAKAGGEYGPDGHWYPGGAFIPDGDFVGKKALGKGVAPDIKVNDKNKNTVDGPVQVVKQKQNKKPRPLAPTSATGLEKPANKLSKLQQRRQAEFFDKNGFLVEEVEIKARKAGSEGRSPLDNQMFTSALANRTSVEWLKEKTAGLRRAVKDKAAFDTALSDATDFISYEYAELNRGMVAIDEAHYSASKSFIQGLFQLAGERVSKKRGGKRPRSINEELVWILNNTLMEKRRA